MKSSVGLILTGVGMAFLFEQIRNGNMKKFISKCKNMEMDMIEDLENMM